MNFLRSTVLALLFISISAFAQNTGPVKVDLEGYIDDKKLEMVEPVAPVKEEPKKEVKKEEPKKEESSTRRRRTSTSEEGTRKSKTPVEDPKPIKKVSLDNFSTKKQDSGMMLYIIIGGGVLLFLIVIIAVVMMKKKKALAPKARTTTNVSLGEKIEAHEQAVAAETSENAQPVMPAPSAAQQEVNAAAQDMADQFAKETAIDDKGQNASGLIIDEDKYFAGSGEFVDEDFSDLDGPHGTNMAPPNPDSPSLPPG